MRTLYFPPVVCYSSSFFPRLISAVADWMSTILLPYHTYHTSWCGLIANLECMSEMCCTWLAGNAGPKKSPSGHHRTTLSAYIFATKACMDSQKNLLNSNISLTCSQNMVNFGPLTTEIRSGVWGTRQISTGFASWHALLHGTLVVGVSQTLRRWIEGATYIRQGGHHVGQQCTPVCAQNSPNIAQCLCSYSRVNTWINVASIFSDFSIRLHLSILSAFHKPETMFPKMPATQEHKTNLELSTSEPSNCLTALSDDRIRWLPSKERVAVRQQCTD